MSPNVTFADIVPIPALEHDLFRKGTPPLYHMSASDEEEIKAASCEFAKYEITTTPAAYKNQLRLYKDV